MTDSSVTFKKSKQRSGHRTRKTDAELAEQTVEPDNDSPVTIASKVKNKAKRSQQKSKLSFGGDDDGAEGEMFKIKKSNLSLKLALGTHPANAPSGTQNQDPQTNGAPVYDAAHLSELRASTQSVRRPPVHDVHDADVPIISDSIVDPLDMPGAVESSTAIPSLSSVQAAKEKRERLRAIGPEQDYISLSVIKVDDAYQGPHPESRLMREEDELGEGDDAYAEYTSAQERIALSKKSKKVEAAKRKDAMQEMIADADEEDEEAMEWEREQLRRGGLDPFAKVDMAPVKQVYVAAPIPPSTELPVLAAATGWLAQSLVALTISHTSNTSAVTSLVEEREQLDARETELRRMIANAETKRSWFADFREWMESVATFLDEKYPKLESLEDEHVSILKERADMTLRRRKDDDSGDLSIVFGSPPEFESKTAEEVDELGREVPRGDFVALGKVRRTARVVRRHNRRSRKALLETDDGEEGYSTDSSLSPSDASDYQFAINRIAAEGNSILSDVHAVEFKDPSLGLARWFGEWRSRYSDSYTGAWGGLGLVGAWEFWVRLELLGWNPFESPKNLDDFSWYTSLHDYSQSNTADGDMNESESSPDGDLVSAMLSTAIVPRICKMLEGGAFDPYSARDTRRMIDIAEQVEASIGADHHKFSMILKAVHTVFDNSTAAAEALVAPFVQFNSPKFDPDGVPARQRLLTRASKLLEMMLRWQKYSGENFGVGQLCVRLINNYVLPIARSGWEVGGEEKARQMIATLPRELTASVNL